jgi:hypothetical protein
MGNAAQPSLRQRDARANNRPEPVSHANTDGGGNSP